MPFRPFVICSFTRGLLATLLIAVAPLSALAASGNVCLRRIVHPVIEASLALCLSSHLPLSAPAQAVKMIVLELVSHWNEHRPEMLAVEAPVVD